MFLQNLLFLVLTSAFLFSLGLQQPESLRQESHCAFNPPDPPLTDNGLPPLFWSSFNIMHKRVQPGGWSRQVNALDFPLSAHFAAVNMLLEAGAVRELHWHAAVEWAIVLSGSCRITAYDNGAYVNDVHAGDLWLFPEGVPHSIQGLREEGCEFLLVFDDGEFSEEETSLLTDWAVHTPPSILAQNLRLSLTEVEALVSALPARGRYIFPATFPPSLEEDRRRVTADDSFLSSSEFTFRMLQMSPQHVTSFGTVRVVDSTLFPVSTNFAMAFVVLKPGGIRELHWHPHDEWQYWISGKGSMTVFFNSASARTQHFCAGDIGFVPRTLGHYIANTGETDLIFIELFLSPKYMDFSLDQWITHVPPELLKQHIAFSNDSLNKVPKESYKLL